MAINDEIPNQDATQSGVNLLASAMDRERAAYRDAWSNPGEMPAAEVSPQEVARQAVGAGEPDAFVDAWNMPEVVSTDVTVGDTRPVQAAMPVGMQGPAADRANSYEAAWAENPDASASMASETFQAKPMPDGAAAATAPDAAAMPAATAPAAAPAAATEPGSFQPGETYYELNGKTGRGDGA